MHLHRFSVLRSFGKAAQALTPRGGQTMSIQGILTAALFQRDEDGRTVMFPNGVMGRGYVVPDAATEQKMRRALMWLQVCSGLFGGIGVEIMMVLFGHLKSWPPMIWAIALASLVVLVTGQRAAVKRLTRDMTPASQRLRVVESLKRQAEAMPRWFLGFNVVIAALMIIGSAFMMFVAASMVKSALSLGVIALFAVVMAQAIYGLTHRAQTRAMRTIMVMGVIFTGVVSSCNLVLGLTAASNAPQNKAIAIAMMRDLTRTDVNDVKRIWDVHGQVNPMQAQRLMSVLRPLGALKSIEQARQTWFWLDQYFATKSATIVLVAEFENGRVAVTLRLANNGDAMKLKSITVPALPAKRGTAEA
jgi:FtsH-binding integral membrane protein